jgi:pre-mRNA 3'-end-processing factor FIP1
MDIDEDDDLYQPEEPKLESAPVEDTKPKADDLEEGEEEDEGAAMDEDDDDDDDSVRGPRHVLIVPTNIKL